MTGRGGGNEPEAESPGIGRRSVGAHWYRASKMTLIASATEELGPGTGTTDHWPVPPSGATSADDYVMVITFK